MDRELDRLEAKMGIYMVPGNHEYISGIKSCEKFIGATKIKLLEDSIITLPCGLQILGRDDLSNRNRLSVNDWLAIINTSKPTIVLDHQPKYLDDAVKLDVTLQFSGHTHHGQFIPISWLTDAMFEISYGFGKRENTNYYVSSGVSLWGPPLRIGTNNEIVIFNLTFE
jgi:predicted MPP superfamily phosphohydrolase